MQALGAIETRGLIAAIESADVMLKAADVSILEKTYVGGGIVYIAITGDVGSVKAAVEAGAEAVRRMDEKLLISQHTIPRPHIELNSIIKATKTEPESVIENNVSVQEDFGKSCNRSSVDKMVLEYGLEKSMKIIKRLKLIELRALAFEYNNFGLSEKQVSKIVKKLLIEEFIKYYENNNL